MRCHRWVGLTVAAFVSALVAASCDADVPLDMVFGPVEPAVMAVGATAVEAGDASTPGGWRIPEALPRPRSPLAVRMARFAADLARRRAARLMELAARAAEPALTSAAGPAAVFDVEGLRAELNELLEPLARSTDVSVHVRELASDDVLFDYRGDEPLNPASNHKLLTTSAALDLLGSEFRFETRVLGHDDALYLIGEGDPSLDQLALRELAGELAALPGLAALRRIVVDDLAFSPRTLAPGFSDLGPGVSYEAPSGALSLDFNTVRVSVHAPRGRVKPGERKRLEVVLSPPSTHVVIDDQASVGRGALTIRTYAGMEVDGQARTVVELTGKLRAGRSLSVRRRVVDPGLYTGGALAVLLAGPDQAPLPVTRGSAPEPAQQPQVLARRESPPLRAVVGGALAWSNNFVAEQLLRTLGWRMTGSPGDWDNGAEVVQAYWETLGLSPAALVFENGSGFSRRGRVTTSALVDLIAVAHQVQGAEGLLSALPVAGAEGTLRARLRRSGKRVRAKTGTMDGISGLSGVITAEDGVPQVAFSILSNLREGAPAPGPARKRVEDRVVMAVLRALDAWALQRLRGRAAR